MMRRRRGFTLVELLVVIAIISLLMAILLPSLGRAREMARQAQCMSNLRCIGTSITLYEHDFNAMPPSLWIPQAQRWDQYEDKPVPKSTFRRLYYTQSWDSTDVSQFNKNDNLSQQGCVMQNWWLLVYHRAVSEEHFHCPSDTLWQRVDRTAHKTREYGWFDEHNVSYGLQPTHKPDDGSDDRKFLAFLGAAGQSGGVPVAGDRPPTVAIGTRETSGGNVVDENKWRQYSANHRQDGTTVLRRGISVSWSSEKDNEIGKYENNIYLRDLQKDNDVGKPDLHYRTSNPSDSLLYHLVSGDEEYEDYDD